MSNGNEVINFWETFSFWGTFFGVFLGIISGVIIYVIYGWIMSYLLRRKAIENLKFEIDFNIKEIDKSLDEVTKYRNKLNADDLGNYFGYFTLSQVITMTIWQMFQDRSIYKILDKDEIGNLQVFYKFFQPNVEQNLNTQIIHNRQRIQEPGAKQQIGVQIDVLETVFKKSKTDLENIKKKLESKKTNKQKS